MKTTKKKLTLNGLLAFTVAIVMAFSMISTPQQILAEESASLEGGEGIVSEIIAFATLEDTISTQEVLLETSIEDLALPETLIATVKTSEHEEEKENVSEQEENDNMEETSLSEITIEVPVNKWESIPEFDSQTMGTYVFTPVIGEAWSLASGVELPTITVQMIMGIMPLASNGTTIDLSDNDSSLTSGVTASSGKYTYDTSQKIVTINSGTVTIKGSTTERQVKISGNANITLDNVNINLSVSVATAISLTGATNTTITIVGDNTLKSGSDGIVVECKNGAKLTITVSDTSQKLTVIGGNYSPGIGNAMTASTIGSVTINGGDVTAIGANSSAAGIGGAGDQYRDSKNGINVTITGGVVTATGAGGNDIGPGIGGTGGTIKITGGSVNPTNGNVSPKPTNGSEEVYLNTLTIGNPSIGDDKVISSIFGSNFTYSSSDVVT